MTNKRKHYVVWIICIVILCIIISVFLPFTSNIQRNITITSGKNLIISKIADLKTYALWYPWLISGSDITADYSGKSDGEGAWIKWTDIKSKTKGSYLYKITNISSDSLLSYYFSFPDSTVMTGQYMLNHSLMANETTVIWRIKIRNRTGGWWLVLFSKRNKLLGDAMESGLVNLKILAEQTPRYHGLEIEEVHFKEKFIATISDTVRKETMFESMPLVLKSIKEVLLKNSFKIIGNPMVQMQSIGKDRILLNIGIPVNHNGKPLGNIQILRMPPGYALCADYSGEYKNVPNVYNALSLYASDHAKSSPAPPWEEYTNGILPKSDTDSCNITIYYPVYR